MKMYTVLKFLPTKETEKYINPMFKKENSPPPLFFCLLLLFLFFAFPKMLTMYRFFPEHSFGTACANLNKGTNFKWLLCILYKENVNCATHRNPQQIRLLYSFLNQVLEMCKKNKHTLLLKSTNDRKVHGCFCSHHFPFFFHISIKKYNYKTAWSAHSMGYTSTYSGVCVH